MYKIPLVRARFRACSLKRLLFRALVSFSFLLLLLHFICHCFDKSTLLRILYIQFQNKYTVYAVRMCVCIYLHGQRK